MDKQRFNLVAPMNLRWRRAKSRLSLGFAVVSLVAVLGFTVVGKAALAQAQSLDASVAIAEVQTPLMRESHPSPPDPHHISAVEPLATLDETASVYELVHLHHAGLVSATLLGSNLTHAHLFTAPLVPHSVNIATDQDVQNAQDVVH